MKSRLTAMVAEEELVRLKLKVRMKGEEDER
jgi:hypothetical protein